MTIDALVRFLQLSLLMMGCAVLATAVPVPDGDPQALVHSTIEQLREAVRRERDSIERNPAAVIALVDKYLVPHIDMRMAARLIMGKHWRTASEAQRQAFTSAFQELLLRTYAVHARDYADAEIDYLSTLPVDENGTRVEVRTRVIRPGKPPARVDYRMVAANGAWKAFDAVINGISIVSTFRAGINEEIRHYGIDGLIERLTAKNQQPML